MLMCSHSTVVDLLGNHKAIAQIHSNAGDYPEIRVKWCQSCGAVRVLDYSYRTHYGHDESRQAPWQTLPGVQTLISCMKVNTDTRGFKCVLAKGHNGNCVGPGAR